MVLLPGFDGSGLLFEPLLAAGSRRLDLRPLPLPADEPRGYEGLLPVVLDALPRRGSYALLAESFSGPLAARVAAERPPRLTHLVLAASFLRRPLAPWLAPLAPLAREPLFALPMLPAVVRALLVGEDAPDRLVALVRRAMAGVPARVSAARAAAALSVDATADLARATAPLLVLAPTRDRLLRADHAEEMQAARPGARVERLASPHTVLQRHPHGCLARVEAFLGVARRRGVAAGRALRA